MSIGIFGFMLVACSTPEPVQPTGKLSDVFATPDWAKFSNSKPNVQRAITPDDLLTADGRCSGGPGPEAPAVTDGMAAATPDMSGQLDGAQIQMQGGVALSMTECEVLHRTGFPDRVDIAAEGTERIVTMSVTQGSWPGLYRFRAGRLVSIERIEVPPPVRPARQPRGRSQRP